MEIDSTYCRIPRAESVGAWKTATPEGFRFASKVPQAITRKKRLKDFAGEPGALLSVMRRLGPKLGPLILRFDASLRVDSLPLLAGFPACLPSDLCYAVGVRRRNWLADASRALLENRRTALVLAGLYYMPKPDRVTTDFAHVRLLGKRSAIPEDFRRVRLDREPEVILWAGHIREYLGRGLTVFAFANNRFQGHGSATARALLTKVAGVASEP